MNTSKLWSRDDGANLVEFALVMPFLLLLLFGIAEFAWAFATNLDVKHGAREGARIIAVDETGDEDVIGSEVCGRMDLVGDDASITWTGDPTDYGDTSTLEVGDGVIVDISSPFATLTGFIDWAFPASLTSLDSSVEIRIEQDPDWSDGTYDCSTGSFTAS